MDWIKNQYLLLFLFLLSTTAQAINTKDTGYKLLPSSSQDVTIYDNSCKTVTNSSSTKTYFIPTKYSAGWSSFSSHLPSNVTITECGISCPIGWIVVPGNASLGTSDFCVMKYEAKGSSGNVVSDATTNIYSMITAPNAYTQCSGISISGYGGGTFSLISNAEWMTIARNAEAVSSNWSGGSVGSGCINQGNSGTSSYCGYDGANPETGTGRNTAARLTLSNGEEIWDFAGNVLEWVDWDGTDGGYTQGPTNCTGWQSMTNASCSGLTNDDLRPATGSYGSSTGVGIKYGGTGGAVARGGEFATTTDTGLFGIWFNNTTSDTSNQVGFRCVWRP